MSGALSADEPVELVSADRAGPELSVKGGWRDAGQGRTCDLERGCVCVCVCVCAPSRRPCVYEFELA